MFKKKWHKVLVSAVALSLTCGVVLSGCSTQSASGSSSAASSGSTKLSGSITVGSWVDGMNDMAKAFMAKYPGTTVTVIKTDSGYTKLSAELAAGSGVPDVDQIGSTDVPSFVARYPKAWLDVSGMLASETSNFVDYALALCKVDGKYYAVPWDLGPCAMFYRKDIFQKAGVDASSIKTYDDYIAAGKKIVQATGGKTKLLGFNYSGSSSLADETLFYSQLGGQWVDSQGKISLNNDKMVQVMTLMKKFISEGVSMNLNDEWDDGIRADEQSQRATLPDAIWYAGTMKSSNADLKGKWGIMPLPAFTAGGNTDANEGGSVLTISADSQNTALAKAFVQFALMSNDGNKINMDSSSLFSSYKKSYDLDSYKAVDSYFGVALGTTFAAYSKNIPVTNFGADFPDISTSLKTAIGNILMKNEDISKALQEATESAQKAADNQ